METDGLYRKMLEYVQLFGHWALQHFVVVIPSVFIIVGFFRTIVMGEIEFRDGTYLARDSRPLLFWSTVVFFWGFAALVIIRMFLAGY